MLQGIHNHCHRSSYHRQHRPPPPTDEEEEALVPTAASPASIGPEIAFRRGVDVTGDGAVAMWIPMRLRGGWSSKHKGLWSWIRRPRSISASPCSSSTSGGADRRTRTRSFVMSLILATTLVSSSLRRAMAETMDMLLPLLWALGVL
ncbi:uncharacterized protein A4U43_C03F24010 [Asparagus officinalis]|uniref:Uncharacterized protein n=1 Tax=Asparagus officinalis TaxID=4686 RepID=A0A5P1FHQ0_ASPOF|nr:uncharacterized protein A4U43_C03F24010 [Asparagus officinalis]